jgi:hypothetical protein
MTNLINIINLIFEQMKKIFFLMLTLIVLSTASMNAQVRIGGTADPNPSAVLDLNENDDANAGTLGLALPRVELTATDAILSGMSAPATGLLVYNTNSGLGEGIYYWSGSSWTKIPNTDNNDTYSAASNGGLSLNSGAFSIATDGVTTAKIANTNVTLDKLASNSVNSDKIVNGSIETADLKDEAVTSAKILNGTIATADLADQAVTGTKISKMSATSGQVLKYNGSTWAPANPENVAYIDGTATTNAFYAVVNVTWSGTATEGTYTYPTGASSASFVEIISCNGLYDVVMSYNSTVVRYYPNQTTPVQEPMTRKCLMRFWQ